MVVFVLLLLSTGFMYYYFQKSRALERELTAWRTGRQQPEEFSTTSAPDRPRSVSGYVSAMRNKIMGVPELPKQTEDTKTSEETLVPVEERLASPPPSTPQSAMTMLLPAPETTPNVSQPVQITAETLPSPAIEPDPFEDELPHAAPTPRPTLTPRPTPTAPPVTWTPDAAEESEQDRRLARPQKTPQERQPSRRTPAPRSTPRKTPSGAPAERIGSMYDIVR